jgi:kinesin family protein 22
MEVARRLEEREKERVREEEERRAKEQQELAQQQADASKEEEASKQTLPSGVLTPLLKRHRDLDDELKARLQELEAKL